VNRHTRTHAHTRAHTPIPHKHMHTQLLHTLSDFDDTFFLDIHFTTQLATTDNKQTAHTHLFILSSVSVFTSFFAPGSGTNCDCVHKDGDVTDVSDTTLWTHVTSH